MYAFVNVHVDNLTQLATVYTADEIAFVKRVLDYMFDTNNTRLCEGMVISGIQAVQMAKVSSGDANRRRSTNAESQQTPGAAQSLSMSQAEDMMKKLVAEGWMEKSRKGFFSLSPRALMELRGWLRDTYNYVNGEGREIDKIKNCAACKEIITVVWNRLLLLLRNEQDRTDRLIGPTMWKSRLRRTITRPLHSKLLSDAAG